MADDGKQLDWIGGGLKKLAEVAVVGLVGVAATFLGLAPEKDITDRRNWPLWAVLILLFCAYQIVWPPLQRAYLRWRVPSGQPEKISILIARIHGDKSDTLRDIVRDAIIQQLGASVEVIPWPESLRIGEGRHSDASALAGSKAQQWLNEKACDVLVWGRAKSDKALALQFTAADGTASSLQSYGLTSDTLELPVRFISDFGSAIAARIVSSAAPAVSMSGHYLVPLMREVANRLEPVIRQINPAFDIETRGSLLHSYALVRATIGTQAGSNADLLQAVEAFQGSLKFHTRDRAPMDWAMAQNNLGIALRALGERESGTARLEEAVMACDAALEEYTRDRVPMGWAMTQNNLGTALRTLGERQSGTARLEEAVTAYRAALEEWSRERAPLDWATTQNNLGNVFATLGERERGTAQLEEAVTAYHAALEERTRDRVPLDWAMTQNNLGTALQTLGERESSSARLEQAVAAYRAALEERTRDRVPLQWAATQNNLGNALKAIGERERGPKRLDEAVMAYRSALEEYKRDRVPVYWAMTHNNLGNALRILGERESGTARLEEAVVAYRAALDELTAAQSPWHFEQTQRGLDGALRLLSERQG